MWRVTSADIPPGDAASLTLPKLETLTDQTPDSDADTALIAAAWRMVERYSRTLWLPMSAGRQCVVEVYAMDRAIVPRLPTHPRTAVTVDEVALWAESPADYAAAGASSYRSLPRGLELGREGDWRLTVTASPTAADIPDHVALATARVFAYLYHHQPSRQADEFGGGVPPMLTGALLKSGAAQLLSEYRRMA